MRGGAFPMPERAPVFDRWGVPELVEPATNSERKETTLEGATDGGRGPSGLVEEARRRAETADYSQTLVKDDVSALCDALSASLERERGLKEENAKVGELLEGLDEENARLRGENEELRQEVDAHRADLIVDVLREVHDPKKGPMTVEQAKVYMRKLFDEALGPPRRGRR